MKLVRVDYNHDNDNDCSWVDYFTFFVFLKEMTIDGLTKVTFTLFVYVASHVRELGISLA